MDFDLNFQELMKIEQGAPDCTWMIGHSWKKSLEIEIWEFMDLLLEFDLNFDFGYYELDGFDSLLRS
jgi:hypothetical protein